jgi:hypothetical protein
MEIIIALNYMVLIAATYAVRRSLKLRAARIEKMPRRHRR